jgi:hypothetical protein
MATAASTAPGRSSCPRRDPRPDPPAAPALAAPAPAGSSRAPNASANNPTGTFNETEAAIERVKAGQDHWLVFADFMRHLADADTSSMTRAFAGLRAREGNREDLPGPPPAWQELSERWIPSS